MEERRAAWSETWSSTEMQPLRAERVRSRFQIQRTRLIPRGAIKVQTSSMIVQGIHNKTYRKTVGVQCNNATLKWLVAVR